MMRAVLLGCIRFYGYVISPMSGAKCRFYPTCSHYAAQAIERHGAGKGVLLTVKRLCKCHPWHKGPFLDPVPSLIDWRGIIGYKRGHCGEDTSCNDQHHTQKE